MSTITRLPHLDANNALAYDVHCSCGKYLGALGEFRLVDCLVNMKRGAWRLIQCGVCKQATMIDNTSREIFMFDPPQAEEFADSLPDVQAGLGPA